MLKRRPPLTTLETRLTSTTVSSRFSFEASILAIFFRLTSSTPCVSAVCARLRAGHRFYLYATRTAHMAGHIRGLRTSGPPHEHLPPGKRLVHDKRTRHDQRQPD